MCVVAGRLPGMGKEEKLGCKVNQLLPAVSGKRLIDDRYMHEKEKR